MTPLEYFVERIEKRAKRVLAFHGYQINMEDEETFVDQIYKQADGATVPDSVVYAGLAFDNLEIMRRNLPDDIEKALIHALKAGGFSAMLYSELLREKLARTNKVKVERIRELRERRWSDARIAPNLDEEFPKKSGKPHTANDVWQYRKRHRIE